MSLEDAVQLCNKWKTEGLRVGFTSGVFDLLHAGHLDYLSEAKKHCDRLIVAVNTDDSVRRLKGPSRPIVPGEYRLRLVRGLKPVDAAFLFADQNNNNNIETLKPDLYIKAGDYDVSRLSSAPIVRKHGGDVCLIPLKFSQSSSEIIETVLERSAARCDRIAAEKARPAVFLDRDGVINEEIEYLHRPEDFRLKDGAVEGMKKLQDAGFALVIATNQAGIGQGYFSHEDFFRVNRQMFRHIAPHGICLDRIFYCPHGVGEKCECRKPLPGMLERGFRELKLIRESSWMVGDQKGDILAGKAAGVSTVLISDRQQDRDCGADVVARDLSEAADLIMERTGGQVG